MLTFLPPLLIALFYPGIYLHALSYAGICCVILLLLLPALMSWRARLANTDETLILVPGGYMMLGGIILISLYLLSLAI
jgi:tyrosine-specific transport protein